MSRTWCLLPSVALLVLVSACTAPKPQPFSPGSPEGLLDVSSEVVNLGVRSPAEVDELSQWVNRDQPTRAELYCSEGAPLCSQAKQALDLHGVPSILVPSNSNTVTLVYERVLARDCNQRYVDDTNAWYNESHASFGCSISGNIVQHVAQKQQFISPNLSDYRDADAASTDYQAYQTPVQAAAPQSYSVTDSVLSSAKTE